MDLAAPLLIDQPVECIVNFVPPHFLRAWVRCSWVCLENLGTSVVQVLYHAQWSQSLQRAITWPPNLQCYGNRCKGWTHFCVAFTQRLGGGIKALRGLDTTFSAGKNYDMCTMCSPEQWHAAVGDDIMKIPKFSSFL